MLVDLNKEDLANLIKGTSISYEVMDNEIVKQIGSFNASYGRWQWNYKFHQRFTESQLYEIYKICK